MSVKFKYIVVITPIGDIYKDLTEENINPTIGKFYIGSHINVTIHDKWNEVKDHLICEVNDPYQEELKKKLEDIKLEDDEYYFDLNIDKMNPIKDDAKVIKHFPIITDGYRINITKMFYKIMTNELVIKYDGCESENEDNDIELVNL